MMQGLETSLEQEMFLQPPPDLCQYILFDLWRLLLTLTFTETDRLCYLE